MRADERAAGERLARVEALLAELERLAPPELRAHLEEALGALLALYGDGLARVLAHVERAGAQRVRDALLADTALRHLLELHGLYRAPVARLPGRPARAPKARRGAEARLPRESGAYPPRRSAAAGRDARRLDEAIESALHAAAPDFER